MDALKSMACLRAAGSLLVEVYKELDKAYPGFNESQLAAAEDWARKNVGSAGAPLLPTSVVDLAAAKAAAAAAPVPTVVPAPNGNPWHYMSGIRVDDVVAAGTPGTVELPVTGHVLSLPMAGSGELFFGYVERVCNQATNGQADKYIGSVAAIRIASNLGDTDDIRTWPEAADRFFNQVAYLTPAEKAAHDAAWGQYTITRK